MTKKLLYLGNRLASKGNAVTTIDTLGPLLGVEGFELYYASALNNKSLRFCHMMFAVFFYGRKCDYVLIDTYSTTNFWYAYFAGRLCRSLNIDYIPILHGGGLPKRLERSPKLSGQFFKNAYTCVAPSRYLYDSFRENGFSNLMIIPNSFPIEEYPFKERSVFRPRLLWVRAFAKIYNPMLALQVLKGLLQTYPDAYLCMVGADKDGSLAICMKYANAHGLPVEFMGKLSKAEWRDRSLDCDIFINTTRFDNMPVSVLEAMALGLPVVSTRVGGLSALLDDRSDALLVDDNDAMGFHKAIVQYMENCLDTREIAARARDKAEGFSWFKVKPKWLKLLR